MIFLKKIGYMQGRLSNYKIKKLMVYPFNPFKEIATASKFNLSHVEFITKEQVKFDKNNLIWSDIAIKKILKINKLYGYQNISFKDNRSVKKRIIYLEEYYIKLIRQIKKANFKIFIIPLIEKSELKRSNLETFANSLDFISAECNKNKINFLVETNASLFEFQSLKKKMKNKIGLVYDTGNRYLNNKKHYLKEIDLLKNDIKHIHLKDRNNKGQNVLLGTGNVIFKNVFKKLKKMNYNGYFTIECTRDKEAKSTIIKNYEYLLKCIKRISH
jgi:sugar phosphate isomerase/epimerase